MTTPLKSYIKRRILKRLIPEMKYSQLSFAQEGEDVILASIMNKPPGYRGFYVDIGAHHPFRFSNTALFYQKGWRGINVEPSTTHLNAFRVDRPEDIILNVGIGKEPGMLTFYKFNDGALNTFDKKLAEERNGFREYYIVEEIPVPMVPLKDILEEHAGNRKIDFMTIDVEGLDMEVLQSNNWEKFAPDYLLIEDEIFLKNLGSSPICNYVKTFGYIPIAFTPRTVIYEKQS